ncbi:heat shock transcription factor [Lentinula edodes]|uniref:Heat shock transcription factor n=1 Tax=Lentinula edodes TaxID=5353 RepID=A0A1Q3E417_LENED|nr:heat shock transcription factor [Lentinula edodes]
MAEMYPPYNNRVYADDNSDADNDQSGPTKDSASPKTDSGNSKPQATFLTKLYALLERPENQHMIRWDPQGEHIIVERPEQLALHVLPSIYRQSRFASFSRQLNIYGFMRKVNLRNVDPAIDDPDASTWSHPTLNRHSPPEVVANFKRRVPPRLPKPRKRDLQEQQQIIPPPRSAIPGLGPGITKIHLVASGSLPTGIRRLLTINARPTPTINTAVHSGSSYSSPFSSIPLHSSEQPHSASSLSPEGHSRSQSGYPITYDDPRLSRSPYHSTNTSTMMWVTD